jgi:hypothetical protein
MVRECYVEIGLTRYQVYAPRDCEQGNA